MSFYIIQEGKRRRQTIEAEGPCQAVEAWLKLLYDSGLFQTRVMVNLVGTSDFWYFDIERKIVFKDTVKLDRVKSSAY